MKLIHYTNEEFSLEPMEYNQHECKWHAKPNGLWFSVEGNQGWKEWCEDEKFKLENLKVSYELELKDDANILHLKTVDDIYEFTQLYILSAPFSPWGNDTHELQWDEVKKKYQGIIIAPYQWDCRLSDESSWYYGWDCASGCIWDLSCIKEFKLINDIREAMEVIK
jgi:hypothetical protein